MPLIINADRAREQRLRSRARRLGYAIQKSRVRTPHLDDLGGYRILAHTANGISSHDGWIVAGSRFELDLDDVEAYFTEDDATR